MIISLRLSILLLVLLPPASDAGEYLAEVEKWRNERQTRLRSPDGWLSLVGLYWFAEGENRFGAAPDNDLVLRLPDAPAHIGVFDSNQGEVKFRAAPGVVVRHGEVPVTRIALQSDSTGEPTVLKVGTVSFYAIERGGRYGLRVKDPAAPARRQFRGLDYYAVDPRWRVDARFEKWSEPRTIAVPTVLDTVVDMPSPGSAVFEVGGKTFRLVAAGKAEEPLFVIFADQTSGTETYPAGRYLYSEVPRGGRVILDFNKAYNPPCTFTDYATCPLPPRGNRLAVAVRAGEKNYGDH